MQLKGLHVKLVAAHERLQHEYASLHEERDAVERQYQQLCDGWRIELESKQAAFDEVRGQILTPKCVSRLHDAHLEQPANAREGTAVPAPAHNHIVNCLFDVVSPACNNTTTTLLAGMWTS